MKLFQFVALVGMGLLGSTAHAEERLVVGVTAGGTAVGEAELKALEDALEKEGLVPLPRNVAHVRFLRHVSKPAPEFHRHELDSLPQLTDSALHNLARGRYGVAKKELSEAMEIGDRGLLTIAREEQRAKQIFDACLYLVRAHWEVGRHDQAREQALRCRRLFPDLLPTSHQKHTPEVRTLMREADEQLSHGPRGALRVTSSPAGCVMRLGGIKMGTTPVVVEDLASQTYRVQVECGPEGRAHHARVYAVPVNEQTSELHVDVSLDEALAPPGETESTHLSLRYDSPDDAQNHMAAHARAILEGLRYDELWLVGAFEGVLVVARATRDGMMSEPIGPVADAHPLSEYVRAVRALANAKIESAPATTATVEVVQGKQRLTATDDGLSPASIAGISLLGAGVAAVGMGWGLHFERASAGDQWAMLSDPAHPEYLTRQQAWLDKRWTGWLIGGVGSISASLGAGLLASRLEGPDWWTWALGGVGLVLGGWGVIDITGGAICDPAVGTFSDVCVRDEQAIGRGLLLTSTGLPLVSFALSAALFSGADEQRGTQVSLEMSQTRAMLRLGGFL